MYTKTAALALLIAYAEARFGQEQVPVAAVAALSDFGNPGEAATLAGQVPGVILAGANSCDKLVLADQIVDTLGTDAAVIAAAQALVGAEKNTNPFAVDIPSICSDAGLPATAELRGIIPLIDPDTDGADVQNANAAASLENPLDADGLSVADVTANAGFDNFTAEGSDGAVEDVAGGADGGADEEVDNGGADEQVDDGAADEEDDAGEAEDVADDGNAVQCGGGAVAVPANGDAEEEDDADAGGAGDGINTSTIAGLDFGLCVPTVDLQGGRNGRPDDELTFAPVDPLLLEKQPEALNPTIIFNFMCDALVNFCDANQAAIDTCNDLQAELEADDAEEPLPRDQSTADRFNAGLGFANA